MSNFKKDTYDMLEAMTVKLTRSQIETMNELISRFPDIEEFDLRIKHKNNQIESLNLTFDLDLTK